ncbi:hypothetical protein V6N13_008912 [Hibiscus sabdariffa]|uniref:RING-type domain-containing protein n=1 Tax=Hibiscus sabdariffa TaxID=183260 RepID=A0ABR2NQV8_9ROSI
MNPETTADRIDADDGGGGVFDDSAEEPNMVNRHYQFDLADAMEYDHEARCREVNRLVSEMATVSNSRGDCSICRESLSDRTVKWTSCGHDHHQTCIGSSTVLQILAQVAAETSKA